MNAKKFRSMRRHNATVNTAIYILLSVMAVIWLIPLIWLIMCSLRGEPNPSASNLGYFFPKEISLKNYANLFAKNNKYYFFRWFMNTFIVACCTCVISSLLVLMMSYTLSRLRFRFRQNLMRIILILGMFPGFLGTIAIYFLLQEIGLGQTLVGLILIYSACAGMGYYIAKGFFDTIPRTLDEAARIDGATRNDVFWKIIMPLSKPIIVYTILMSFMGPWMDFMLVSIIMRDATQNYTVSFGLYKMIQRDDITDYFTTFAAGSVFVATPISILFILMQKFYVDGITGGAVKG